MKKLNIKHSVADLIEKEAEQTVTQTVEIEEVDENDLFTLVDVNSKSVEQISVQKYSYWKSVFKSVIRKPSSIISIIILVAILTLTII